MKKLILSFGFLMALFSTQVFAYEKQAFDKKLFDELQDNGVPVLVDVWASWCPTCKKQQNLLSEYFSTYPNSKIKVLIVDFDEQKQWVKHFKAPRQSSLYIYKDNKQHWFSVAETRKNVLFDKLKEWEI
jgi:thiol-disulfide isomerase/thioredoxin